MPPKKPIRRVFWIRIAIASLVVLVALIVTGNILLHRAAPILKSRVEETLSARFNSRVTLESLNVSISRGLNVSGNRLMIYPPESMVAAGATQPLIAIRQFSFYSGIIGLFFTPMRVGTVQLTGLEINIPPRELRQHATKERKENKNKIKIVVEEIVCSQSRLTIGTLKPDKDPKVFELTRIDLHNVGPNDPWRYEAVLTNAIPRGEIHAAGTFGPWQTESPGDSTVTGHYTFNHADMNTIKGLAGILSSVGDFKGVLNHIAVEGTTDTPDFSLDTANHPLPLHTRFEAIVDGTSGDTYLKRVEGKLRNSNIIASGEVINIKGVGHRIDLDVAVADGRLQDFLDLAVKTTPAVMRANINLKTKLQIQPGKESVTRKLGLDGAFQLRGVRFTNAQVQDKVDMLSLRAQGEPEQARPGARDVSSRMEAKFQLAAGVLHFSDLAYTLPGARVNLTGVYSLDGRDFDFGGKVLTDAPLSQMVESRVASLFLKAVSPFFKRKGGGAEIPVSISGTQSAPKFGLDVMGKHSKRER